MKIKLLLFGEAVSVPKTAIGLGVGFVSVWIDNVGYTSASNQIGTLGHIFLETQQVDIGTLSDELQQIFSNLTNRTITFDIAPTLFVKDGGIADIALTALVQSSGVSVPKKISFRAENCTGVSVTTNALNFTCELHQLPQPTANLSTGQLVPNEEVVSVADAAPSSGSAIAANSPVDPGPNDGSAAATPPDAAAPASS